MQVVRAHALPLAPAGAPFASCSTPSSLVCGLPGWAPHTGGLNKTQCSMATRRQASLQVTPPRPRRCSCHQARQLRLTPSQRSSGRLVFRRCLQRVPQIRHCILRVAEGREVSGLVTLSREEETEAGATGL